VTNEDDVRDTIIRATNNQTTVELASLHATDKIQRDIEDILKQCDLYYERRTNYYKNQGIPTDQILTPLYLASGYVSLFLKAPDQATRLKSRFMRSEPAYEKVFSLTTDLNVWPQISNILKSTDNFLETVRPTGSRANERFLKSNRHFLSFLTISRLLNSFNFSVENLINLDLSEYSVSELQKSWDFLNTEQINSISKAKIKRSYFVTLCQNASEEWGTKGMERITKGVTPNLSFNNKKGTFPTSPKKEVTMEFALKVNEILPDQPWKPGVHKEIISKLSCTNSEYFDAVKLLIEEGERYNQKDGVVYDEEGNVLIIDEERVDSETLQLKE
jgi:hypothetical protein